MKKVYNLTVNNFHTYFVGVSGVLGHNAFKFNPNCPTFPNNSGLQYELYLQNKLGGSGGFKTPPPSRRGIDGKLPDGTWYEAKMSLNFALTNQKRWAKTQSQLGEGLKYAKYILITTKKPPQIVINWLNEKGIKYKCQD